MEDDLVLLRTLSQILEKDQCEVFATSTPCQALAILRKWYPYVDAVLLDVGLLRGLETDVIRQIAKTPLQAATVFMTDGSINPAEVPPGIQVLKRPVSKDDLLSAMNAALSRSRQARANIVETLEVSARLRLGTEQVRSDLLRMASLLTTQLNIALTFMDPLRMSTDPERVRRTLMIARRTYHTALGLLPKLKPSDADQKAIREKLGVLKARMDAIETRQWPGHANRSIL